MARRTTRRAQKPRVTHTSRVAAYLKDKPQASKEMIGRALKLDRPQVDSCIISLRKRGGLPSGSRYAIGRNGASPASNETFTPAEVLAVRRIGAEKVKAIIKLLEQLEGG